MKLAKEPFFLLGLLATTASALDSVTCTSGAQQVVQNPSFEDGVTDWTIKTGTYNQVYDTFKYSKAVDGSYVLAINGDLASNGLSQELTGLVVGDSYSFSLYWQLLSVGTGQCTLDVYMDSTDQDNLFASGVVTSASDSGVFRQVTGQWTATSTSHELLVEIACTAGTFSSSSEVNFDDITLTGPTTETCSTSIMVATSTPVATPSPSSSLISSSPVIRSSSSLVTSIAPASASVSSVAAPSSSAKPSSTTCLHYESQVITNPSFENGLTGWDVVTSSSGSVIEGDAEDGDYYLHNVWKITQNLTNLDTNSVYDFSMWVDTVYTDWIPTDFFVDVYTADVAIFYTETQANSNGWAEYTGTWQPTETSAQLIVEFYLDGTEESDFTLNVDNIQLVRRSTTQPVCSSSAVRPSRTPSSSSKVVSSSARVSSSRPSLTPSFSVSPKSSIRVPTPLGSSKAASSSHVSYKSKPSSPTHVVTMSTPSSRPYVAGSTIIRSSTRPATPGYSSLVSSAALLRHTPRPSVPIQSSHAESKSSSAMAHSSSFHSQSTPGITHNSTAARYTTSTLVSTHVYTTTCAPSMKSCSATERKTYVTTETILVGTTICPVTATETGTLSATASPTAVELSQELAASTVYTTLVETVTACPSYVTDCSASEKTTYLTTKTLASQIGGVVPTAAATITPSVVESTTEANRMTASTVYTTHVETVTACPPYVTDCPASERTTYLTTKTMASEITAGIPLVTAPIPTSAVQYISDQTRMTTSTVHNTLTHTVTACPSSVKDCPASEKTTSLTTETVIAYTTVCPVTATETDSVSSLPITVSGSQPTETSQADTAYTTHVPNATAKPEYSATENEATNTESIGIHATTNVDSTGEIESSNTVSTLSSISGTSSDERSGNTVQKSSTTVTKVYTFVACPSSVYDCPASEKTTYTSTATIVSGPMFYTGTAVNHGMSSKDTNGAISSITEAGFTAPVTDTKPTTLSAATFSVAPSFPSSSMISFQSNDSSGYMSNAQGGNRNATLKQSASSTSGNTYSTTTQGASALFTGGVSSFKVVESSTLLLLCLSVIVFFL